MTSQISKILENNAKWAETVKANQPDFFSRLLAQQTPQYMWIGCSDSRVPANEIIALAPGEVFVHRNIANVVVPSDLNALSTIQFAVERLRVEEILVVGHYGCAGVYAAMNDIRIGLADNWIRHIQNVKYKHMDLLNNIVEDQREFALCELNAIEQAMNVVRSTILQDAWRNEHPVTVHSLVYSLKDGLLRCLGLGISNVQESKEKYLSAIAQIELRYKNHP